MTERDDRNPRVETGSARRLTRRDFLRMVGASCVPFPLACAGRQESSSDAGSGGATVREPAGLEYRDSYGRLAAALSEEDLGLDFVHLDCPYEIPQEGAKITWEGVKEVQSFMQGDIGARFGFVCTSRTGGETSDEAWNDNVLDASRRYAEANGLPDEYVIMSWFPHPGSTIPESAGPDRFPDMKTVLSFARALDRYGGRKA